MLVQWNVYRETIIKISGEEGMKNEKKEGIGPFLPEQGFYQTIRSSNP
ncbi:MAG: hypothetical protein IKC93_00255 [Candidatus Methanomethylophilaceae archaeon]|nr:hypothetical protein [Candidatus Methanomethylophilaceae archaeon]